MASPGRLSPLKLFFQVRFYFRGNGGGGDGGGVSGATLARRAVSSTKTVLERHHERVDAIFKINA